MYVYTHTHACACMHSGLTVAFQGVPPLILHGLLVSACVKVMLAMLMLAQLLLKHRQHGTIGHSFIKLFGWMGVVVWAGVGGCWMKVLSG